MSAWLLQREDLRNHTFPSVFQETPRPLAVMSQKGGLPIRKRIKWKTWHQKKRMLETIGSSSPVYCRQTPQFDALDTKWGDHAWVGLAEPIFLQNLLGFVVWYGEPFLPCLTEWGWIVWLLLAHIQARSSHRTQAVAQVRELGNVTFCLCQGMGMSSEIQKLPWTFLPSLVLFTTWVYLGHREMSQNWLGLYLAL